MSTAPPHTNFEFLPVTRFPVVDNERHDSLHEIIQETRKERENIQAQPYRTTQLIFPNPKVKPDLVKNKVFGGGRRSGSFNRPDRVILTNLNSNQALVNRQRYNNPRALYSDQNVKEAIYVQTGVNYQQPASSSNLSMPIHRTPDSLPDFKPQNSPTYRVILEQEGPGTLQPAPSVQKMSVGRGHQGQFQQGHSTAPSHQLNSVGMPSDRIAQSGSFKRLMYSVMGEY